MWKSSLVSNQQRELSNDRSKAADCGIVKGIKRCGAWRLNFMLSRRRDSRKWCEGMGTGVEQDEVIAAAFDRQAERFQHSPFHNDPRFMASLLRIADLPTSSYVLDVGCGPGLVSLALLEAGHRVVGVDLSSEMIRLATERCAAHGGRGRFMQISLFDNALAELGPFDAAISRHVLHHVGDPLAFARRQAELARAGGCVVVCDHTTDPRPRAFEWHHEIEVARDHSHARNLTAGQIVDLLASAGLVELRLVEEAFALDFDEWFDRGVPERPKDEVRARLLSGESARGFRPTLNPDGSIRLECWRATARGVVAPAMGGDTGICGTRAMSEREWRCTGD